MEYIVHKHFKAIAICGEVNLPSGTPCEEIDGLIFCNGEPLCVTTSENAHKHFARNDDGQGLLRGKLTQDIQRTLAKRNAKYQARWDKIWECPMCQKYKRIEHADYWLWNTDFFNAPIEDLKEIAKIIKEA